ncbi:hypothetical protein [Novosphingobium sp. fls2-241-R2A-195]|jgi:hypothetical protein|uniref:hypothetical protein n=1 Tax=Novosphingobium sp. fls2-241-R2A-195 TaxID=3040296 RepID=UPI00254FC58A|nr:hypothetical protein [Novosphingobium sp. fls2-241-R2A-195]
MNIKLKSFGKKLALGAALAASVLVTTSPAQARDRYYGRGDDTAAIAIGAGVIGLALGAAIADRGDRNYYDRGYWGSRRYVTVRDRPGYYYYYDGSPNRYYRDRYYDRYYSPWSRDRWRDGGNRWDRGRDWRRDRHYDRRDHWGRRDDRRWDRRDGRWDRRDDRRDDRRWRDRDYRR